jgi:hypothetical protein
LSPSFWKTWHSPQDLIRSLRGKVGTGGGRHCTDFGRKLRLYACALARIAGPRPDEVHLLKASEILADGGIEHAGLAPYLQAVWRRERSLTRACALKDPYEAALLADDLAMQSRGYSINYAEVRLEILRDLIPDQQAPPVLVRDKGRVYRLARRVEPYPKEVKGIAAVLGEYVYKECDWLTPQVIRVAEAIYDEGAFSEMPVLADALEDDGCDEVALVDHCRQEGHYKGCFVLDQVLGRECLTQKPTLRPTPQ